MTWVRPAVTDVNGEQGPSITLDASDIPSTGPSDVQTDLDLLQPITTEAQLAARFTLLSGVYQIDMPIEVLGTLDLTASGNTLAGIAPLGELRGCGSGGCMVLGLSASPLISGQMALSGIILLNLGAGDDIDIVVSTALVLRDVIMLGQSAGRIRDISQSLVAQQIVHRAQAPNASGLRLEGTLNSPLLSVAAFSPGGTPYTGLTIPASATYDGALFTSCLLKGANATDALFDIADGATTGPDNVTSVTNCVVTNALGELFRAGSVDSKDVRMSASGNLNASSSRYQADPTFTGGGTPILLTHVAGVDVLPSENVGPTATLLPGPLDERFILVINSLQDWYVEYVGRINNISGRVLSKAVVARSGGSSRPFTLITQVDIGGIGSWADIGGANATIDLAVVPNTVFGEGPMVINRGDRLRLVGEAGDTTITSIDEYTLGFTGSP